jgi:histidinol-phosphatase (PHP family)
MFPSQLVKEEVPVEVCYAHYWEEALAAVKAGGFDAFGHFDFPKRYYHDLIIQRDQIQDICNEMVGSGIAMEINTSSLRKGLAETMPGKEILSIYQSCGGKYVTVGSDAHSADELAAGNREAQALIDYFSFEEVIYVQRQAVSSNAVTKKML